MLPCRCKRHKNYDRSRASTKHLEYRVSEARVSPFREKGYRTPLKPKMDISCCDFVPCGHKKIRKNEVLIWYSFQKKRALCRFSKNPSLRYYRVEQRALVVSGSLFVTFDKRIRVQYGL